MTLVTDDVVYAASVGPEPGATYRGRDAVRRGFAAMLAYDAALEIQGGRLVLLDDVAYAEWAYVVANAEGVRTRVRGIDVLEFRGGLIARKDAFRKTT